MALILFALSAAGAALMFRTSITGDEPRYLYYAASLGERGDLRLGLDDWRRFVKQQAVHGAEQLAAADGRMLILGANEPPAHAIGMPVLAAALVPLAPSLPLARIATLAMALATLWLVFRTLRAAGIDSGAAALAVAIGGLSIPFLPHAGVFYPEMSLAFLTALGWRLLYLPWSPRVAAAVVAVIIVLPFMHLRGVAGSAALAIFLAWRIRDAHPGDRVKYAIACGVALAAGAVAFSMANLWLYGSLTGSVTTARPMVNVGVMASLLLDGRHGLLVFSPVLAFGVAGVMGAWRSHLAIEAAISIALVIAVSLGPNAGASPPARFLVQAVPALTVGLALWLQRGHRLPTYFVFAAALAWTVANSIYYVARPERYFDNRATCHTCFDLLRMAGWGGGGGTYRARTLTPPVAIGIEKYGVDPLGRAGEIKLQVRESGVLEGVHVVADGGGHGSWSSRAAEGTWGVARVDPRDYRAVLNKGPRGATLGKVDGDDLTLLIPDNGALAGCVTLSVSLRFADGRELPLEAHCDEAPLGSGAYRARTMEHPVAVGIERFGGDPLVRLGEIRLKLRETGVLGAVEVHADDGRRGHWTTRDAEAWGVAVVEPGTLQARNAGPRRNDLRLPVSGEITLLIADNGALAECVPLTVGLGFVDGRGFSIRADCER